MEPTRILLLGSWALIAFGCNALFDIEETTLVMDESEGGVGGEPSVTIGGTPSDETGGARSTAGGRSGSEGGASDAAGTAGSDAAGASGNAGAPTVSNGGHAGNREVTGGAENTGGTSAGATAGSAGASCNDSEGGCGTGECEEGTEACSGDTLQTCVGGQIIQQDCPFGCDGVCWECDPGAQGVCGSGNTYASCSANGKLTKITCIDECTPSGCAECEPDETQCVDPAHLKTCRADGYWGAPTLCDHKTCVGIVCVGECAPGESRCSETGDAEACDSGGYFDTQPCTAPNEICSTTSEGSACRPNPPYTYGNKNLLEELPVQPTGNILYLFRLPVFQTTAGVPRAALLNLGLVANASPPGLYAQLAIYAENTQGLPGDFVSGVTTNIPVNNNANGNVAPGSVNEAMLQDENRYWIGVVFSGTSPTTFMPTRAGSSMAYSVPHQYTTDFPATLSPDDLDEYLSREWNLFVTVQDRSP